LMLLISNSFQSWRIMHLNYLVLKIKSYKQIQNTTIHTIERISAFFFFCCFSSSSSSCSSSSSSFCSSSRCQIKIDKSYFESDLSSRAVHATICFTLEIDIQWSRLYWRILWESNGADRETRIAIYHYLGDRWYENEVHVDKDGKETEQQIWHNVNNEEIEIFKFEWNKKHESKAEIDCTTTRSAPLGSILEILKFQWNLLRFMNDYYINYMIDSPVCFIYILISTRYYEYCMFEMEILILFPMFGRVWTCLFMSEHVWICSIYLCIF
jgi:hypothetical protein